MGNQLGRQHDSRRVTPRGRIVSKWDASLPNLDGATRALVLDIVRTLASERADLLAIILFGSVARGEERPLDDVVPSDVDVLVVLDSEDERVALRDGAALFGILGKAYDRHLDAQRDIKVQFSSRDMSEWDAAFVANVAHDGLVLWSRGPLPTALHSMAKRSASAAAAN